MDAQKAGIQPGDILMDATTFQDAFLAVYGGTRSPHSPSLLGLAQLIQAIVIHNRILIEPSSYGIHMQTGFSQYLQDMSLNSLVEPIQIRREDLMEIEGLAVSKAHTLDKEADEIYKNAGLDPHPIRERETDIWLDPRGFSHGLTSFVRYKYLENKFHLGGKSLIAYRAYFYFGISCCLGLPYLPHVSRIPFIEHELRTRFYYKKASDAAVNATELAASIKIQKRNKLIGENIFKFQFPLLLNYVISKVKSSWDEVIPIAHELRESTEARAFRKLCTEIDAATREGDLQPIGELLDELNSRTKLWLKEIEEPTLEIGIAFPLSIQFDLIRLLRYLQARRERHLIFLDKLYGAAIASSKLSAKIATLTPSRKTTINDLQ
jgi:hypothetical protein